jgi:hypothetical protein
MIDHMALKYKFPRSSTYIERKKFLKIQYSKAKIKQINTETVENVMNFRGNNNIIELKEIERLIFWNDWIEQNKDYSEPSEETSSN